MRKLWTMVSGIGVYPELETEEVRRLQLMNRLNFITFVVLLFYIIMELIIHVYIFVPALLIMLLFVVITFILLYNRRYQLAKNYAVLTIAGCICFFDLATGPAFSEALLIPLSVMPLIIFRRRRSALFYLFFIGSLAIALNILQPYFRPWLHLEGGMLQFFRMTNVVSGIMVTYSVTHYFKKANQNFERKLIRMNELVSEKNKEITDSINYARHIQSAILPSEEYFRQVFPESFIVYQPKDIVAGDFYWLFEHENGKQVFFAAADCTGHGVPGAMVSVVCSNALNRTLKEFAESDPGRILDKTTELVVETFSKSNEEVKDGMDISFCVIDKQTNILSWAGANNPLWLIRKGELKEWRPDKQPIGKSDHRKPFATHQLQLEKDDMVYLFTDGFADQFGGNKGKKYKYSRFKELLLEISGLSPATQKSRIEAELFSWKGELEQVDDILVLGLRI